MEILQCEEEEVMNQGKGGQKIAILVLVALNLLVFTMGAILIPRNLRERKASSGETGAKVEFPVESPITPPVEEEPDVITPPLEEEPEDPIIQEPPVIVPPWGEALSTEERPDLGDFLWYVEGVQYEGIPEGAEEITDFASLLGGWKGLFLLDPDNEMDAFSYQFLNIRVEGSAASTRLVFDWYSIFFGSDGSTADEMDTPDGIMVGSLSEEGIYATGAGNITITDVYFLNGRQYALGAYVLPDGVEGLVAMVRP